MSDFADSYAKRLSVVFIDCILNQIPPFQSSEDLKIACFADISRYFFILACLSEKMIQYRVFKAISSVPACYPSVLLETGMERICERKEEDEMGVFEFLMLCCFGFSWPFSIVKSLKSRSAKGKSLGFMLLVELGYVFGIIHKILYSFNWVIWAYVTLFMLVAADIVLFFRNSALDRKSQSGK